MRAAAFVRYHSGDGFGHVGWAFDVGGELADAGSVENHSGHIFTPATRMGFWNERSTDPVARMREHRYDDLKWIDVAAPNPILAYRTVLWIRREAYKVLHRNCEDDVYDVLRAYGAQNLAPPSLFWFPKTWFGRFDGTLEHVASYAWPHGGGDIAVHLPDEPWQPTWRRPWHLHFHALKMAKLPAIIRRRSFS
jgi:hypothetical protein